MSSLTIGNSMIKKYVYGTAAILFFGFGIYLWKIMNTGLYVPSDSSSDYSDLQSQKNLVIVGEDIITKEDIDWEYSQLTSDFSGDDDGDLTSIPELYDKDEQLKSLRDRLVSYLIERKLLYNFVKQDTEFNISDPARYSKCIGEWQISIKESLAPIVDNKNRERLKSRLCERDIILQYLDEVVFKKVQISDTEVADYYKNNVKKFEFSKRVLIRQIVLGSEKEAKKIRHKVRSHSFESFARKVSITPEASSGGLLGPFSKGEMPRVFDAAFSMRRGEIRGILKSTYGFHIIKLEKKFPKSKLSLREARPKIVQELRKQKQEKEYQVWVEMALSAVPVKSPRPL